MPSWSSYSGFTCCSAVSFMSLKTRKSSVFKTNQENIMVSCNLQFIQSQNKEFLLAKVLKFPTAIMLGSDRLREGRSMPVSFEKDQEEERSFLLRKAVCCHRRHTCLSNCPASQPTNSRLLGEQGQFHLFPFLLFKGDFLKTGRLVTIVELWLPRGLYISKHEGICVAIKHSTFPNQYNFLN